MATTWGRVAKRIRVPMGFAFSAVFVWLAQPTLLALLLGLPLVVPGLWLRGYASGYVKKNAELTTTGPYAYTRNPLYLGSMMIAFGFAVAAQSWWIAVLLTLLFAVIYIPVIRGEEAFLRSAFPDFDSYAARVPRLFPSPFPKGHARAPATPSGAFDPALYRKHREYNALIGAMALYLVLIAKLILKSTILHPAVGRHWF